MPTNTPDNPDSTLTPPTDRIVKVAKPARPGLAGFGIAALIVLMFVSGLRATGAAGLLWIVVCFVLILVVVGLSVAHRIGGVLINEKNVMSLSRLQMVVWTVLILSSYLAYALARIRTATPDPLDIQMDWHLWALMGISTASLIGSPLVLSTKAEENPSLSATDKTASLTNETPADVNTNRRGLVYANPSPADATFTDIFQGDEIGNTTHTDLAKIQMFFFTLIIGLAFFWSVIHSLATSGDLSKLPTLSDGAVWLLGISHAGYLSSKGLDHTKTT